MSTYFILNVCMVNGFSNMSNLDLFSSVEPEVYHVKVLNLLRLIVTGWLFWASTEVLQELHLQGSRQVQGVLGVQDRL